MQAIHCDLALVVNIHEICYASRIFFE